MNEPSEREKALEAALRKILDNLQTVPGAEMDAVTGPKYLIHGFLLNDAWRLMREADG